MSDISKHIENLKEYIRIDKQNIEYTGDFGEFCKKHIEDIEAILKRNEFLEKNINKIIDIIAEKAKINELKAQIFSKTDYNVNVKFETLKELLEEIKENVEEWK